MFKLGQRGSVFLIFVFIFAAVAIVGGTLVIKTLTTATKKISQTSEVLSVAMETEYNNPFDKKTQYVNPFGKKNPFDELE